VGVIRVLLRISWILAVVNTKITQNWLPEPLRRLPIFRGTCLNMSLIAIRRSLDPVLSNIVPYTSFPTTSFDMFPSRYLLPLYLPLDRSFPITSISLRRSLEAVLLNHLLLNHVLYIIGLTAARPRLRFPRQQSSEAVADNVFDKRFPTPTTRGPTSRYPFSSRRSLQRRSLYADLYIDTSIP